jgi:hypothetical protein
MIALQLPLPFPAGATIAKDRSNPFPCMDSPCGCRTAEQCWKDCCCTTKEERLAWVKALGIPVPAALASADDDKPADTKSDKIKPAKVACCTIGEHGKPACHDAPRPQSKEEPASTMLSFASIMRCRGITVAHAELPAIPQFGFETAAPRLNVVPGRMALIDEFFLNQSAPPPTRPPQPCAAVAHV